MPNLTFFRKESAFASDDLVPISMAALAVRLIMLCCSLGVAAYIGIRLDTCKPNLLAILIAFLFAAIFTNLLLVTVDCSALAVSTRGSIMSVHHREPLVHIMIGLQMILSLLEIAVSVLGAVSAWLPEVTNNHPCAVQTNVMKVVMGYTIIIWILLVAKVAYFLVLFDPLQCCSLQSASYVDDSEDEEDTPKYSQVVVTKRSWKHLGLRKEAVKVDNSQKSLYNTKTANLWFRYLSRLTNICACKSKANDKSALEAIAKAFAILLCEKTQQLVISDVVAAVLLTKREQVIKMKLFRDSVRVLTIQNMKEKTGQLVEKIGERFEPESYNYDARIRLDLTNPTQEDGFRLKRAIYFFQYSIGVYGWPMYCFQSPLTACCKLTYKTGALCPCRTSQYEFERPTSDRCGCNTSALALSAGLSKHNIVHISNHNEMFKAPYAVLVDHKLKTLVISIRGTMSIKDVLTDLSISLKEVRVNELPFSAMKTQVHLGMYQTAMNLAEELLKLKLLGIFFDRYPEYSLTIVGHSLGAGVASALALLFKIDERLQPYIAKGMECFAYSPPGCVFSYPLVQYSKSFVTSIVLNSDAVPCLNWRSLLFLKHSMLRQLRECEKPKHHVLYRGLFPKPPCVPTASQTDDFDAGTVSGFVSDVFTNDDCLNDLGKFRQRPPVIHSVSQIVGIMRIAKNWKGRALTHQKAIEEEEEHEGSSKEQSPVAAATSHFQLLKESKSTQDSIIQQLTQSSLDSNGSNKHPVSDVPVGEENGPASITEQTTAERRPTKPPLDRGISSGFCDAAKDVSPIPAFIPGRVYHIKTLREPSCLFKKYTCRVNLTPNEDFGVIRLDGTTLKSHLPNNVDKALQLLNSHLNASEVLPRIYNGVAGGEGNIASEIPRNPGKAETEL